MDGAAAATAASARTSVESMVIEIERSFRGRGGDLELKSEIGFGRLTLNEIDKGSKVESNTAINALT